MGLMNEVSVFAKGIGKKAKGNYDVVAMNTKVSSLRREIQGIYSKIGEQYYAIHKETPDEALRDIVEEIKDKENQIAEMQKQIEDTKAATAEIPLRTANTSGNQEAGVNVKYCANCGSAIPEDSCFCTNCGTAVEDVHSQAESIAEGADKIV